jgi:adenylate cyclase
VAVLLRAVDLGLVPELRLRVFDLEERLWPRSVDPARVVIVDIDEKSLAKYGQWPWQRSRVAKLVQRIADGHPRVLGIDIVFAEPDRLSPPEIAREVPDLPTPLAAGLAELPPSERGLASAMQAAPTVLAAAPSNEEMTAASSPMRPAPIRQSGNNPAPFFLMAYKSLLQSLPELSSAAHGVGAIVAEPDDDGIVRRAALAVSHQGRIIPSFALEVLRVAGAEGSIIIDTDPFGIEDIRIGGIAVPTDERGRAILHFAPPLPRYISAAEVLDLDFDPTELRSQIVLLGVAGLGIAEHLQTPFGIAQDVDIHAQLIESMLLGVLLHRPPYLDWVEIALTLAAGLGAIWLLRYDRPMRAASFALATIAGLIGFELLSFGFAGLLFDGTFPALTVLAAFGIMLVGTLRAAEAELRRHREATQRFEGELAAARAIQMGLLPRRLPAFPDHPEIDICVAHRAGANRRRRSLRLFADRSGSQLVFRDRRRLRQGCSGRIVDGGDQGSHPGGGAQIWRRAR